MLLLDDVFRRMKAYVSERGFSDRVFVVKDGSECVRIGDARTDGVRFHIELTHDTGEGVKFRYALSIYLREFERVVQSRYRGNDDFADGKWLEYTHITWGGSPSVRISFVRAEPPDADDGVWKDCVFDLLDACVEEYVRSASANDSTAAGGRSITASRFLGNGQTGPRFPLNPLGTMPQDDSVSPLKI